MLYNESKHKILASVGKANKDSRDAIFFFGESAEIERTMMMLEPAYVYEFRFSW
jgi:hypothetical protein